ncbi:MAG: glucosaminidase domain-containing protein [Pseudomonadota bacterium]
MRYLASSAIAVFAFGLSANSVAAKLPQVSLHSANQTPACVTPGRLTAYLKDRNPRLRERFAKIAADYMRHGENLKIRWDYAFFQMMLETNALKYTGDVHWKQNNFAGLGATGGGVKGERFRTVSDGVRAHLEHLLIYAGVYVDNPVADRTRKIQKWKVLAKWQRTIKRPMTYRDIGVKWAPKARDYAPNIEFTAQRFFKRYCDKPDPYPELLAEAQRGIKGTKVAKATQTRIEQPKKSPKLPTSLKTRAALGASEVQPSQNSVASASTTAKQSSKQFKIINQAATSTEQPEASTQQQYKVASAAGSLAAKFANPGLSTKEPSKPAAPSTSAQTDAQKQAPPAQDQQRAAQAPAASKKCRVWTASYGGQKAIIIKSSDKAHVNYTVLDVNQGREKQETAAYISAYAKGGSKIAEYDSPTMALDQAFKLCPDG